MFWGLGCALGRGVTFGSELWGPALALKETTGGEFRILAL